MNYRLNDCFKYLFLIFIILTAPSQILCTFYTKIADENIKSIPPETPENKNTHYYSEHLRDSFEKQANPTRSEKRILAFNIAKGYEKNHEDPHAGILDSTSWQDLNLLNGPKTNPEVYLSNKIDRTSTEIGKVRLYRMVTDPLTDTSLLRKRQAIVQELIHKEALFLTLDQALQNVKKTETSLYSFWQDDSFQHAIERKSIRIPWWNSPMIDELNKNSIVAEVRERLDEIGDTIFLSSEVAGMITLPLTGMLLLSKKYAPLGNTVKKFAQNNMYVSPAIAFFSVLGVSSWIINKLFSNKWTTSTHDGVVGINYSMMIPYSYDRLKATFLLLTFMQAKLIAVSHFVNALKEVQKIVETNSLFKENCAASQIINDTLTELPKQNADFRKLLDLLSSQTFDGEPSMFSRAGNILATYKLMHEQKDHLTGALLALGEIDVYMSTARLYKERQNENNAWCFAQYTDQLNPARFNFPDVPFDFNSTTSQCADEPSPRKPALNLQHFWNPFIDPEIAITNSISLGTNENPQTIIITGPNAGGKSTTMKGVVLSIILAQTLGIAPGYSFTFTPVSKIMTYLTITDDIAAGNSHFETGVIRAQEIIEMIKKLKDYGYAFIAIDELFNGTTYREGQAAAYTLIEFIGKHPRVLCTTATHFPFITNLEQLTNGVFFKNYKVTVSYDEHGRIHYPFKLEPGISRQSIALDILREKGFDNEFLNGAQAVLRELPA